MSIAMYACIFSLIMLRVTKNMLTFVNDKQNYYTITEYDRRKSNIE